MIAMKALVTEQLDWKCNVLYWMLFDLDQHLYYRMHMVSQNQCQLPWLAVPIIVGVCGVIQGMAP